ncbi:heptaprenyl pyrophosphate synthase subunit A [Staphylococcus caprae]|uniref:heptaprenyl pyrophosphate synthase subunit A n=1 Tax=Staphylococcus caprae TaxID=29380 RepID=UPI000E6814E1|nr:heptaprenyl pyrophosphate synthase subunit A [Staphylococcus caprae]MBU5270914.1 heptaprenyl diphosphate synthase component 1 [Staphylococcus caprae]MDK6297444.1 heptaprenyl pyrophosphate synthase subunit A [Staphylococcus caprae]MDK7233098.1 heptaprenyl pyrophosphate synthase subunit A [Staphylococcus caprae]RIM36185.1 heptaprenyl pyrophosphate synthase subunit A [Staphylococcus caprae]
METTISKLNRQIEHKLKGINDYESIHINSSLSALLDSYQIPEIAKLACLTIDTSMRHLDDITKNNLSKNAILIGDLLSAHYYTLLAEMDDPSYQLNMSKAIVKVNELKSSLHQHALPKQDINEAIIDIEVLFPYITISHFKDNVDKFILFEDLTSKYEGYYPSYLKQYTKDAIDQIFKDINQSYTKRRGNEHG